MNLTDLSARIGRLDRLAQVLAREVSFGREGDDPLRYLEEKTYVNALLDALAGVQGARIALASARRRLENELRPNPRRDDLE
jgi:hypothetical protein